VGKTGLRVIVVLSSGLACVSFTGCGSGSNNSNSNDGYIYPTPPDTAYGIASNAQVSCNDPTQCSPSVGMLTTVIDASNGNQPGSPAGECTAFLVSPQIMATNSHCIPKDLKAPGSSFANRGWVYFPSIDGSPGNTPMPSYPAVAVTCDQVLGATTLPAETRAVPDYAFFHLSAPVSRPILVFSREGLSDGAKFQLVKVDPTSKTSAVGSMVSATCTAVHNSILVPKSNDDLSGNMLFSDCTVIEGNSGSPLMDSLGQVHAVIQMLFESDTIESRLSIPLLDGGLATLNAGTNFGCVDIPAQVGAGSKSSHCADVAQETDNDDKAAQTNALSAKLVKSSAPILAELNEGLDPMLAT